MRKNVAYKYSAAMGGKKVYRDKMADLELKKAFSELQRKMVGTGQKLQLKDLQINQIKRVKQENESTCKEFAKLSDDTIIYESVGRSFILSDINQMKVNLIAENKNIDEKIIALQNDKLFLTRNLAQSEENLRELVQQKKKQGDI
ncbi:hypothetical protein PGB90_003936 [Kerria lacca]